MELKYKLKNGTVIDDVSDFVELSKYYEAACTAGLIQDDYFPDMSDDLALTLGYEVRRRMDKCEYSDGETEMDTIADVLRELKDRATDWLSAHEQAAADYNKHFGVVIDEGNDVDVESMVAWIYEHDELAKDFEKYFLKNPV